MAEHPDALQTLPRQHDKKITGRKWTDIGLPLLYCLFNLADDTAMIFATKTALMKHGFALILLLRDFGLDTHLPTDANPAPKTAAMCVHTRAAQNNLRAWAKLHRTKAANECKITPFSFDQKPAPPLPIEILPFDTTTCAPVVENYGTCTWEQMWPKRFWMTWKSTASYDLPPPCWGSYAPVCYAPRQHRPA
jgi:hypothetical protein